VSLAGDSLRMVATRLGRAPSTISRELARAMTRQRKEETPEPGELNIFPTEPARDHP